MRRKSFPRLSFVACSSLALVGAVSACGAAEDAASEMEGMDEMEAPAEEAAEAMPATVRITQPEDGSTTGPDVLVILETEGIEIVSITPPVMGTGHHHVYVDADLTPLGEMIPQGDPLIIHKGDGASEIQLEGLAPGPHRLIAVVADPAHIPLDPPVIDTVHFTVGN